MLERHPSLGLLTTLGTIFAAALAIGALAGPGELGIHALAGSAGSAGDAAGIFAANLAVSAAIAALAAALTLARAGEMGARAYRRLCALCDFVFSLIVAGNVVAAGLALGALGAPALARVVAHAPFELAGFACALGLYLDARFERLHARRAALLAAGSVAALAYASAVESFVSGAL